MDDIGLKLCNFQSKLFEESKNYFNCSSIFFIRNFMNSSLVARLDNKNFIFEARDIKACLSELNINNNIKWKKINKYPSYVLAWIGYLYRYACYEYNISSSKLYSIVKPNELYMLYEAYHSLDLKEAIYRIFESKNIDIKKINKVNYIEIARKIYIINQI